jgi:hypothetical protein
MGKFTNGLNGPFTGRIGNMVGSTWNGMPVLRSRPNKRSKAFSSGELQQQGRFALLTHLLKPVVPLLNETFRSEAGRVTAFNRAFSYNIKNAVAGRGQELQIDFPMLLLGRGDLPPAGALSVAPLPEGVLSFSWTDNSGRGRALGTDQAYAAAYCEAMKKWIWRKGLAPRSAGSCRLSVPEWIGQTVHSWLGLLSADGREASDSVYTGLVEIGPATLISSPPSA